MMRTQLQVIIRKLLRSSYPDEFNISQGLRLGTKGPSWLPFVAGNDPFHLSNMPLKFSKHGRGVQRGVSQPESINIPKILLVDRGRGRIVIVTQ